MKTKITFLTIAIAALLGVGMLMAFKNTENGHYVIVTMSLTNGILVVSDETTQTEIPFKSVGLFNAGKVGANNTIVAKTFSEIYNKGYKLKSAAGDAAIIHYVFEKE